MTTFEESFRNDYIEELLRLKELYNVRGDEYIKEAIDDALNNLNSSNDSIEIYLCYLQMKEIK
jgi:hypothetical protein